MFERKDSRLTDPLQELKLELSATLLSDAMRFVEQSVIAHMIT